MLTIVLTIVIMSLFFTYKPLFKAIKGVKSVKDFVEKLKTPETKADFRDFSSIQIGRVTGLIQKVLTICAKAEDKATHLAESKKKDKQEVADTEAIETKAKENTQKDK